MASAPTSPATGASTVTVYCKHPHGLILRVGKSDDRVERKGDIHERTVREWRQTGSFTVSGPARRIGEDAKSQVIGGYAVTHGVPKELWEAWLKDNETSAMVRNGVIFAHEKPSMGDGQAAEQTTLRSGLEALSQEKDMRAPGSRDVSKMTAAA